MNLSAQRKRYHINWAPGDASVSIGTTDHWTANGRNSTDPATAVLPIIDTPELVAKSLIIPAVGARTTSGGIGWQGTEGWLWSSTPNSSAYGYRFGFTSTGINGAHASTYSQYAYGVSIRCVRP